MTGAITVQSVLNQFLVTESLDSHRRKVCSRLIDCRTARMGGMEMQLINARCAPFITTVAGTGIAHNARGGQASNGVSASADRYCRFRTSTWCLPYLIP